MDDEETFGHEFYRLGFGRALEQDLLSEYKVLIVVVKDGEMAKLANNFNHNHGYKIDDRQAIDIRFATKIVGSWEGLSKRGLVLLGEDGQEDIWSEDTAPMRRALAFSKSIQASKQTTASFDKLVKMYVEKLSGMVDCRLRHVDGTMNAAGAKKPWIGSRPIWTRANAASSRMPIASPKASMCRRWTRWCFSIPANRGCPS